MLDLKRGVFGVFKMANETTSDCMYHLVTIKNYYSTDFSEENEEITNYLKDLEKKRNKKIKLSYAEIKKYTQEKWKELILKFVNVLLTKIEERKTKGSEFNKIKKDLEKTRDDIPYDNLDLTTLKSYYEDDLQSYRDEIKEKIDIEKYNNRRFWIGLLIGAILGIIGTIITTMLL